MKTHFNQCPLHPLFTGQADPPAKFFKKRTPIAVRAQAVAASNPLTRGEVEKALEQRTFSLGGNNYEISVTSESASRQLIASAIFNLSSIFKSATIGFYFRDVADCLLIHAVILPREKRFPQGWSHNQRFEDEIFRADITLMPGLSKIKLMFIQAMKEGIAGRFLAALYNFAKDNGIATISYYANPANTNAQQFYLHMDFGRLDPEVIGQWVLRLGLKNRQDK